MNNILNRLLLLTCYILIKILSTKQVSVVTRKFKECKKTLKIRPYSVHDLCWPIYWPI